VRRSRSILIGAALALTLAAATAFAPPASRAREGATGTREDHDGLIVLRLRGSYQEIGRQQVELLGSEARSTAALFRARFGRAIEKGGAGSRLLSGPVLWGWTVLGPWLDDSGLFEELAGIASGLGVSHLDALRIFLGGLYGGSTAFVATGAATADGGAVLGRNIDWSDDDGVRVPVVTIVEPEGDDLAYVSSGWPLGSVPIVGLNDAGLALSVNFFHADEMSSLSVPRIPYRRALQRARTVEEALAIFEGAANLGGPGLVLFADASGAIALLECTVSQCARFAGDDDVIAESNHARTPEMGRHDLGRTDDSLRRLAAMEAAVAARRGGIDPAAAAAILRERSGRFVNQSVVANPSVLSSIVVQPAARVLWHSTARQPLAPYGELVPLSPSRVPEGVAAIPADPRFGGDALARDAALLAATRDALRAYRAGDVEDAGRIWDELADAPGDLDPARLAWARALVRWRTGRLDEARALLQTIDVEAAPFGVAASTLVARAILARPDADAAAAWQRADELVAAHPDITSDEEIPGLRAAIARAGAGDAVVLSPAEFEPHQAVPAPVASPRRAALARKESP